jgi:hypothetical protein
MMQLLWKTVWQFLKKLNTELLYDLAVLFLATYPREPLKIDVQDLYMNL